MADTTGHTIELPIKSNFREGLDVLSTSCLRMELVKVFPIQLFVQPTRLPDQTNG